MTKKNKIIMWSTISCLLAVAVAGSAIGITYARYGSTGKGTGTATVAYWDVTVAPSDDTTIKAYAAPSADAYEGGDSYDAAYARTSTSSLILAATATNPGNIDALVSIEQKDGFGYELREGIYTSDDTNDYLSKLDDHFSVILFQSTEADLTSDTDLEELDTFTLESGATTYIYCEVVWTSDIADCFGTDADAFDTWIGSNVDYLTFTLAYSATQVGLDTELEPEPEPEPEPDPEPDPEPEDANHAAADWYYLTNSNVSGAILDTTGNYCLTEDVELNASMTISADITLCLNGHSLSAASGYSLNQLISVMGGNVTIEDCQENGYIGGSSTNGISISGSAALTLTSGEIKDSLYGITLTSGATLNLSGTPVITGNNTANVYLESGALISLGELTSGADIGVTSASNTGQISSIETDTYYYESAIDYIYSDNSEYKVAASHSGYLHLIDKEDINVTFALEGTNSSKPSNTTNSDNNFDGNYYIEGFDGNWDHVDGDYLCTEALSEYKGSAYSYDIYYDMGVSGVTTSIDFVISPYKWQSGMGGFGLGPDATLTDISWNGTYNNFNLYATQAAYVTEGADTPYYTWANWKLDFGNSYSSENGMTTILEGIGDFTIVLEVNFNSVTTVWEQLNNVVSGVYFIADGQKISLTTN